MSLSKILWRTSAFIILFAFIALLHLLINRPLSTVTSPETNSHLPVTSSSESNL